MEVGHDLAQEKTADPCKCGNEPSRAMQCGGFFFSEDLLSSQEGLCST